MNEPNKVEFCKRCVISNYRPSSVVEFENKTGDSKEYIQFKNGLCSACIYHDIKETISWDERRNELEKLCDEHRNSKGVYDCIIPGSGGKDSGFTAHYLKYEMGMNPLTVTWAPHEYTKIGWENFKSWVQIGGFDNHLVHPNGDLHRKLTYLAFKNLGHPFQPFIIGQKLVGPRFSVLYDVPLVFYGENQAEYGNNIEDNATPTMDNSFFAKDWSNSDFIENFNIAGNPIQELLTHLNSSISDFYIYRPLDINEVNKTGTEVHYLGYYLKWDPQEMFYYSAKNTGFKPNDTRTEGSYSKYAGIDDKIDWLHYYMTLIKFGIGRTTYDASQEVRNNKITREEAVGLVRKYDSEFPKKYFVDNLNYMNINEDEFWKIVNSFRNPLFWEYKDETWNMINQI